MGQSRLADRVPRAVLAPVDGPIAGRQATSPQRNLKSLSFVSVVAALLLSSTGCGGTSPSTTSGERNARPSVHRPDPVNRSTRRAVALRVTRTSYGPALTDQRGFALYRFTHDRSKTSTCYGPCAAAWPPYVVSKPPSAVGPGARVGLLSSVRRRDGRIQVTYKGRPLYRYIGDHRPGEVLCQAVAEFGGSWYVVAPDGNAIH
jgi:predicted lipoprotein with Yx(FWY)xxD motif